MTPTERAQEIVSALGNGGRFVPNPTYYPGTIGGLDHLQMAIGQEIAAAVKAERIAERERLVTAAERVRQALEMATAARGETSEGARLAGWLLNGIVGGERVAVEGQPMPTAEEVAKRIREG